MILEIMLYTSDTSQVFIIEPVDICMSKLLIARTAIYISSIHIPQV